MRRRGDSIRLTVVLVETEHGTQVWGERFDIQLDELDELEDDIVMNIVGHIESQLKGSEENRARRKPPEHLGAWPPRVRRQPQVELRHADYWPLVDSAASKSMCSMRSPVPASRSSSSALPSTDAIGST